VAQRARAAHPAAPPVVQAAAPAERPARAAVAAPTEQAAVAAPTEQAELAAPTEQAELAEATARRQRGGRSEWRRL